MLLAVQTSRARIFNAPVAKSPFRGIPDGPRPPRAEHPPRIQLAQTRILAAGVATVRHIKEIATQNGALDIASYFGK